MQSSNSSASAITVYACGGGGVNIASFFENVRGNPESGFADIQPVYIDTSKANLRGKNLDENNVYLIPGVVDGSGKFRKENAPEIKNAIPDILRMHKPGKLSIVISTGSGGSGSVIGPFLVSKLLEEGHMVAVATVGTLEDKTAIQNTIDLVKSYENISMNVRKRACAFMYYENSHGVKRSEVDKQLQNDVLRLSGLFSDQNLELDSADLKNWANYDKVTDFAPKLMALQITTSKAIVSAKNTIVSVAILAKSPDDIENTEVFPYSCTGYVDPVHTNFKLDAPVHFALLDGVVNSIYANLQDKKNSAADASRSSSRTVASIVSKDESDDDSGVVL